MSHFNDIKQFLNILNVKFDVIALSETWLIPNESELSDYMQDGYSLFTTSRIHKRGGNICK